MKYKEYIAQRKDNIPETAFHLFARRGIEAVTMQQIADESDCGIASLYRYYGTKLKLVIEIAALKWRAYAETVEADYEKQNGAAMNGMEEFAFCLSRYMDLYQNYKELLKFNFNFDLYVIHEQATKEDMAPYYESVGLFAKKFHVLYEKALNDHTMRTDIDETQLYFGSMYAMLTTAAKYSYGTVYPVDSVLDYTSALEMQMRMILDYVKTR
ncbi:TetR/AcrR family transcriptional regulator [Oscillibacter sp.]|uniref:TetR/AcrR family transcriptional regulator n=1 Tax=Oscillibacter sp. TaxID=1945593 RepID=UPI00262BF2D4|nr:TetR/AcrR family transcriptional regulator [Oscillibacter sp.]MDD3347316.1 helix-turn-helix domain containing protein [Oscillibacter sp.]